MLKFLLIVLLKGEYNGIEKCNEMSCTVALQRPSLTITCAQFFVQAWCHATDANMQGKRGEGRERLLTIHISVYATGHAIGMSCSLINEIKPVLVNVFFVFLINSSNTISMHCRPIQLLIGNLTCQVTNQL